uniref:DUF4145 domain-containing protein n=1 Tax=Candidatus Electronema sp. TaxID=2698783 RepID=UPI004057BF91
MEEMLHVPHPPSITRNEFNCPHCGAHSSQTWFDLAAEPIKECGTPQPCHIFGGTPVISLSQVPPPLNLYSTSKQTVYRYTTVLNLHLSKCFTCEKFSIWVHDSLVFPNKIYVVPPNPDLPDDVRQDYEEASKILDMSPRGSAALLRLAIQKLCIHLGESGENINKDIASLVKKGLDQRVQQALDIVRVVGNNAVHPGKMDINDDKDTARTLFRLVNLIAEKMISEPKHVQSLFDSLPEGTRKQIEKRDK